MKHCRPQYPKKVSQCPIVSEVYNYNKRHQNEIIWCTTCNGEITGITEISRKLRYEGGLIQAPEPIVRTKNYEFLYAYNCYAGKSQQKLGRAPYNFYLNGDLDKCFRQRIRDYFKRIKNRQTQVQLKIGVGIEN